ncbi:MAG: XRE family transcriptional regulator [Bacillota bacterium]|nr:MAG: XRE family transcriptional regulator [Bacillota bacterium]
MRKGTTGGESKLAALRAARGLGQRELAEKSGVNIRQIQSFESGERDMRNASLKNALALADALGVHPRELI